MPIKMRSGAFIAPFHPIEEDPTLCIQRDLELVEYIDRLGFDEAWVGEHHSGGFEIIASPELFLAAAAERTKRIRLGTGVVSLSYHHPLMVANRILQLDHQTQGRIIFGMGPGLYPADAFQMGVDPRDIRDRMAESIAVILKLLAGERVTHKASWFTLDNAACQLRPYSWPLPEMAVASVATPSGGTLAGRYGFGMLCLAATKPGGFDALDTNWRIANEIAAEHGQTMDRAKLRLVAPVHLAETRAQAVEDIKYGFEKYSDYIAGISSLPGRLSFGLGGAEEQIKNGEIIVGTPDDAIAQIRRLQEKQGEFGCFLLMTANWANFERTKKSYELWLRHVAPVINKVNAGREDSFHWVRGRKADFLTATLEAGQKANEKFAKERAKSVKAAE